MTPRKLTGEELKRIAAIAEKATPTEWTHNGRWQVNYEGDGIIANAMATPDAAHIAALNPETALALIDELQALREALGKVLIKVDWNSDEFHDAKQYAETRQLLLDALGGTDGQA